MTNRKLIRVFPRRTSCTPRDRLAFVGDPPLFRPPPGEVEEVHVSVTFTWDLPEAERLRSAWAGHYPVVKIGGPALDPPAGKFVPGRYMKPGVTFTSRGCDRKCPWCRVPGREGKIQELQDYPDGWIVQDNNLLQTSQAHQAGVFDMLRRQPKPIELAGGIDVRLLNPWFVEQVLTLRLGQIFLAADTRPQVKLLEEARELLRDIPQKKLRVYTLIGFGNDTIAKATERLERVWSLGCIPYAQLYQPEDKRINYSYPWRLLSKQWSRPAIMYSMHKVAQAVSGTAAQLPLPGPSAGDPGALPRTAHWTRGRNGSTSSPEPAP